MNVRLTPILLAALFAGCDTWHSERLGSAPISSIHADLRCERIEMVYYSDASNPSDKQSRLFVSGGMAFRTIAGLKSYLLSFHGNHELQFVLEGWDVEPGPTISSDEVRDLVDACRREDVLFTFSPGG